MTKVLTNDKDLFFSPWTTGVDKQFEKHHYNDSQEDSLDQIISTSPSLLRKIKEVRESLKEVRLYDDKDMFGDND